MKWPWVKRREQIEALEYEINILKHQGDNSRNLIWQMADILGCGAPNRGLLIHKANRIERLDQKIESVAKGSGANSSSIKECRVKINEIGEAVMRLAVVSEKHLDNHIEENNEKLSDQKGAEQDAVQSNAERQGSNRDGRDSKTH